MTDTLERTSDVRDFFIVGLRNAHALEHQALALMDRQHWGRRLETVLHTTEDDGPAIYRQRYAQLRTASIQRHA